MKIDGETEKDYNLYCKFLQHSDRDLIKFALQNKIHVSKIHSLSLKNDWYNRAQQFDESLRQEYVNKKLKALDQLATDQAQIQSKISLISQNIVLQGLEKHFTEMVYNPDYSIKPQDLEKINNIYKSLPAQEEEDDTDLSALSDDDLLKLEEIIKPGK